MKHVFIAVVSLLLITPMLAARPATGNKKFNVLFIAIDDLRPAEIACFGSPDVKSPNIDALARTGLLFNRAYCQQAVCSPSRTSLMTGRRPDTTKIYDLETHFRDTIGKDVVTLAQHFKNNGYHAQGFGKIYHGGLDDPASWSVPFTPSGGPNYANPETLKDLQRRREQADREKPTGRRLARLTKGPSWEAAEVDDDDKLPDGRTANDAMKAMNAVKEKAFFLAVGFIKPHLPFVAPKKYFELYPPASEIKLPENSMRPANAPELAFTDFGELRGYIDMPQGNTPVSEQQAKELIRAYRACVSYTDAQIGRLLAELDRLQLRENTIVILWGDHGWHLLEQGMWCKHTNFENAARAPLILSVPDQKNAGAKTDALVEFVDIYPTLCDAARLPKTEGLEGTSFLPLLDDPNRPWKSAAFSQYPRPRSDAMGYSMRTDRYRYTEWQKRGNPSEVIARELYDHETDARETKNVAGDADRATVVKELSEKLKAGWRAATPAASASDRPKSS